MPIYVPLYPNDHFECGSCHKAFPAGWRARENHCDATGHRRPRFECDTCCCHYQDAERCAVHMDKLEHWNYECAVCPAGASTEQARNEHEVTEHYYCSPCERHFQTLNSIRMHLNSRVHRGTNISCPFCSRDFATATGVTHHIESGGCPCVPNVGRDELYRIIRSRDPGGTISKHLIGWHGSSTYEANGLSWNGRGFECYLCHRSFTTLHGLNQHLNSPAHQQALYHCPKLSCRQDFKSLAGLMNHLESETCGYMRFETVQTQAQNMIRGGRLLGA